MDILLFANTNLSANSDTFSKLAHEGVPGIVITMIVCFAAMFVICRWLDVRRDERREVKKDKELTQLKIDENLSRNELTKTLNQLSNNVKEMTFLLVENMKSLKESVKDVDDKVSEVSSGVEEINSRVDEHDKILDRHEIAISDNKEKIERLGGTKAKGKKSSKK